MKGVRTRRLQGAATATANRGAPTHRLHEAANKQKVLLNMMESEKAKVSTRKRAVAQAAGGGAMEE